MQDLHRVICFRALENTNFVLEVRGEIEVKGKGKMTTHFLIGEEERDHEDDADSPIKSDVIVTGEKCEPKVMSANMNGSNCINGDDVNNRKEENSVNGSSDGDISQTPEIKSTRAKKVSVFSQVCVIS